MAKQSAVIKGHLRIEGDNVAGGRDDQRINLDDRAVERHEGVVHGPNETAEGADLLAPESERIAEAAAMEAADACCRVYSEPKNLLGMLGGDFLDLHTALGGRHDG